MTGKRIEYIHVDAINCSHLIASARRQLALFGGLHRTQLAAAVLDATPPPRVCMTWPVGFPMRGARGVDLDPDPEEEWGPGLGVLRHSGISAHHAQCLLTCRHARPYPAAARGHFPP